MYYFAPSYFYDFHVNKAFFTYDLMWLCYTEVYDLTEYATYLRSKEVMHSKEMKWAWLQNLK